MDKMIYKERNGYLLNMLKRVGYVIKFKCKQLSMTWDIEIDRKKKIIWVIKTK